MRCVTPTALYTKIDAQCETGDGRRSNRVGNGGRVVESFQSTVILEAVVSEFPRNTV